MDKVIEVKELITGVEFLPKKIIQDGRGAVLHYLRADSKNLNFIKEIYFSTINPGFFKGWKKHLKMSQNLIVPIGSVEFILIDDRPDSRTKGTLNRILIDNSHYGVLHIPNNVWYGFKCISKSPSLISNVVDHLFEESEVVRVHSPPYEIEII